MLNLLLGLLLAGSVQAGGIIQGGVPPSPLGGPSTFTVVNASTVNIPSFGANRIVTTGAGGVLVTYSTFSLTGTGVGIGVAAPGSKLSVVASGADNSIGDALGTGANFVGPNETGQGAILKVASNDAPGINLGGSIGLGGRYTGTGQATWAMIKGLKADATDGNYGGYISFWTRTHGSGIAERMRITDGGSVGIGTASPCSTCTLHVAGGASVTGAFDVGNGTFTISGGYAAIGYGATTPDARLAIKGTTNTMYLMYKGDDSEDVYIRGGKSTSDIYVGDTTSRSVLLGKSGGYIESKGGFISQSRTIAQLLALAPDAEGQQFYCSNCSPKKIVVSTGTSAGNFAAADGGAFQ